MKVLVTGADGFIGSHLVESLVEKGYEVVAFCLYNSFGSWGWLDTLPSAIKQDLEVILGDIRDPQIVRSAMKGCSQVYHLAALIPRLPRDMNLTLDIRESNFGVDISSNQPIDFLALDLQLGETEGLVTNWVEGVSLNMSDDGGMDAKVYITGISPKVSLNILDVEEIGTPVTVSYTHLTLPTNREV